MPEFFLVLYYDLNDASAAVYRRLAASLIPLSRNAFAGRLQADRLGAAQQQAGTGGRYLAVVTGGGYQWTVQSALNPAGPGPKVLH